MEASQIYIVVSIVALTVVALLGFFVNKNKRDKQFTPLARFAFMFILAGIIFGDDRLIGYSLIGIGIIFAVIDIIKKLRSK